MNKFKTQKKSLIYGFVAVLLVVVALVLLFAFKGDKDEDADLFIFANDIQMADGESKKIEYKVNPSQAVVKFFVRDEKIAEIKEGTVFAKEVGETEIIISARYEDSIYEKTVELVIKESLNDDEIGSPNTEPAFPPEDENFSPNNPEESLPTAEDFGVQVLNNFNCEVEEMTIRCTKGKIALINFTNLKQDKFSIYSVKSNSKDLKASLFEGGQETIKLESSTAGEYKITIFFGEYVLVYDVIFE